MPRNFALIGAAVFTNSDELVTKIKALRVHGQSKCYHHQYIGLGARMDTLQAAVLNVKLKYYAKDLALRQAVAAKYSHALQKKCIVLSFVEKNVCSAWAQYSVRVKDREQVQMSLKEQDIPTTVHYPVPLHRQECFSKLNYSNGSFPIAELVSQEILSLPMNSYLEDKEIKYICKAF